MVDHQRWLFTVRREEKCVGCGLHTQFRRRRDPSVALCRECLVEWATLASMGWRGRPEDLRTVERIAIPRSLIQ